MAEGHLGGSDRSRISIQTWTSSFTSEDPAPLSISEQDPTIKGTS